CKPRITWLRTRRSVTFSLSVIPITITAGTIATSLVSIRRAQGLTRQWRNPSMTTWPARVPVMVLLCPLASSATANSTLAADVPRLHQGRVQVQVMGHHGRADDADGNVDHVRIAKPRPDQCLAHLRKVGRGLRKHEQLDEIADTDGGDEDQHHRFDQAHAQSL